VPYVPEQLTCPLKISDDNKVCMMCLKPNHFAKNFKRTSSDCYVRVNVKAEIYAFTENVNKRQDPSLLTANLLRNA